MEFYFHIPTSPLNTLVKILLIFKDSTCATAKHLQGVSVNVIFKIAESCKRLCKSF